MQQIETEIFINSNPEKVWAILTDFGNYPEWNPFIRSISGKKEVGEQLKVFIQPPGGNGMTFKPKILVFQKNKEFQWLGKFGIKGIFDGEHYFKLEEEADNKTKFIQGERFTGILIPLMGGILKKTREGFEMMNEAIRKQAEVS